MIVKLVSEVVTTFKLKTEVNGLFSSTSAGDKFAVATTWAIYNLCTILNVGFGSLGLFQNTELHVPLYYEAFRA